MRRSMIMEQLSNRSHRRREGLAVWRAAEFLDEGAGRGSSSRGSGEIVDTSKYINRTMDAILG